MERIYEICPICDSKLEGLVWYCGTATCPKGHYKYAGLGSYASEATITINGNEENFYLDDMFSDWKKLEARVKELRLESRINWGKQGF